MKKKYKENVFSDKEIVDILVSNHSLENDVLQFLYKQINPSLKKYIINNRGCITDVEDIIQDAIIVFYEKVRQNKFKLHSNVIGYIYTTGKYMWHNKLRKNKKQLHVTLTEDDLSNLDIDVFDIELFNTNETIFVNTIIKEISETCQTVLKQSIYENISMSDIAKINGYKNEQIARNKKYNCLKQLRFVIENSKYYKSILNQLNHG